MMEAAVEISVEISHRNYYYHYYATAAAAAWDMTMMMMDDDEAVVKIVRVVEIDVGNYHHHLPHRLLHYFLHLMHDDIAVVEDDYTKAMDLRIDSNDNYYYCSVLLRHYRLAVLAHQHYPHSYYY
jgi:hypothetical protein